MALSAGHVDRLMRVCSGILSSTGRHVESLRSQWRSQLGRSGTDCGQLPQQMSSPETASGFNSSDARTGVGGRSLGDVPGVRVKLRQWISVAVMVWGARSIAAQSSAPTRRSRGGCG